MRPTAPHGALLREVVTHKNVTDHQKASTLPTTRPIPPAKTLSGTCSRLDAIKYLQSHDMHGHIDIALPTKFALSHNLNAMNAHSAYWFSDDVALFVLGQMIVPWARAQPTKPAKRAKGAAADDDDELVPAQGAPHAVASEVTWRSEVTGKSRPMVALLQVRTQL